MRIRPPRAAVSRMTFASFARAAFDGFVVAVAVGRFHDQRIRSFRRDGVTDDGQSTPPDVTREDEPFCLAVFGAVEDYGSRAEDVSGIDVAGFDPGYDVERLSVRDSDHEIHRSDGVSQSIQRLDEFLLPLGEKLSVPFLNVSRVRQHDGSQIPSCRRRPDRLVVAFRYEIRKPARMVDVRVGENDGVELRDRYGKLAVLLRRLLALPLEHPAVERDGVTVDAKQVARARDFPGGTRKSDLQDC